VILPCGKVQLLIINACPPTELDSCGNELTLVVVDHGYTGLFRNDLDGLTPSLSEMG